MNWNELSDDSWNEISSGSDQQQHKNQPQVKDSKPVQQSKKITGQDKDIKKQEPNQEKDSHKQKKNYSKKESKKFPTDQQILQDYEADKIQDNRRLKALKCHEKQQQEMLQTMLKDKKIMKLRNFRESCYVLTFFNKDDLIKFIKEKIEKSYKFKIAIYVQSKQEKQWKAQKEKERSEKRAKQEQQKERHHKDHRDHRDNRQKKDQKYREKQEDQKVGEKKEQRASQHRHENKEKKNQHRKDHSREKEGKGQHKGEQKDKKNKIKNLKRENERKAQVNVISDDGTPSDVVQWIIHEKLPKQFKAFKLFAPGSLFAYMDRVSQQILKTLKFGMISQISQEECQKNPEQIFHYEFSQGEAPKPIKKSIAAVSVSKPTQECFDKVQKYNTHIIESEFDEKQYVQLFKKNYQKIVTKWQNWIFYAYNQNIAKLLRLSGTIKKLMNKNKFNYEIGKNERGPFVKFQICDLNKTKFKVDTSVINSHLQNA